MLILSREVDEDIYIGDDIRIKVVEIKRGKIRLGIDAPDDCVILRGELRDKIQRGGGATGTLSRFIKS